MDQKTALEIAAKQVQLAQRILDEIDTSSLSGDEFRRFRKTLVSMVNIVGELERTAGFFLE